MSERLEILEPCIIVRINRRYRSTMSTTELYDVTRGVWRIGPRRSRASFALAVFKGEVKEVFSIESWHKAGSTIYRTRTPESVMRPGRWEFVGTVADAQCRCNYIGKRVDHYFTKGSRSPIIYVGC